MFSWYGFLLACTSVEDTASVEKNNQNTTCDIAIDATVPVPNANDVYYRSDIQVRFSDEEPAAQISVFLGVVEIEGEIIFETDGIIFDPKEPLEPNSEYRVDVQYCGSVDPVSFTFRTSDLGTPLDGGDAILRNRSYMVDLGQGRVITPTGVGDYLQNILENTFLFDVQEVQDEQALVRIALSHTDSTEQNFCVPTIEDFPQIDLSQSPYFNMYGNYVPIVIDSYRMNLYNIEISGTVASEADHFDYMVAEGIMDLREVYPIALDFNINAASVDDFTQSLAALNVEIVACSDGELYCTPLVVDSLKAEEIFDNIEAVCEPHCHESCMENYPTCSQPQQTEQLECSQ